MPTTKEDEHSGVIYDVTEGVASPETRKKYAYHFKCFLNHFEGITEESLLQEEPRVLEAMIIRWIRYLSKERQQKHDTIHNEVAAVLPFFDWNDVHLNKRKINKSIPEMQNLSRIDITLTKRFSRFFLSDERSRTIILLMASTGMRLGGLARITIWRYY